METTSIIQKFLTELQYLLCSYTKCYLSYFKKLIECQMEIVHILILVEKIKITLTVMDTK